MLPGRPYDLKIGCQTVSAVINTPKSKTNINTMEQLPARTLTLNEIGNCTLSIDKPIAFDAYRDNRQTGGFILIDRVSHNTVGTGMINFALRRADNIHWQALDIDKAANAQQKGQTPAVLWFTGLSGSGKSTIANAVQKQLYANGRHSFILDGDNVRHGLNRDLGFTDADRVENIRRVAEVSKLMVDAGLITLVSFISPFRSERRLARNLMQDGEFIEIYIDTPLDVAETRDPKGLYKKARSGKLKNFTGVDSPYEAPENAEIIIDTTDQSPEEAAEEIIRQLVERGLIRG
jgi:bifunctional enzyme CysN/CysC